MNSNTIALTISDISVRQDSEGRYCLNDLHKASGGSPNHRPSNWLRNQQAKDLINELSSNLSLGPVETIKGGNAPGIFVVKELVYAYAMWISAKFHIAVIRAYDALVTGKLQSTPEPKTKKALPGCLTLETQDEIKQLIKNQAALLPKDKQVGFIIAMWSALGTHFGIKKQQGDKTPAYKYIPEGARLECLSLIARLSVDDLVTLPRTEFEAIKALPSPAKEGELLPKEALPDADALIRQLRDDGYLVARANRQGLNKLLRDYIPHSLFNELIEVVNDRLKSTDHEQIIIRKEMLAQITRTLTCMGVIYDGVLVRIEQAEQETGLTLYNR